LQKINFIYLFYFHARQLFHQNLARWVSMKKLLNIYYIFLN
jgi:hypothetical protein